MRLRTLLATLAVVAALPEPARANGRFPASSAVIFDPRDARTIYVRVTFGLLVSHDAGATWDWICERAIGFSGVEDPTYVVTPKGTLVGGTFSGIGVSRDGGCSFGFAAGAGGGTTPEPPRDAAGQPLPRRRPSHHGSKARPLSDLAMRRSGELIGITSVYTRAGKNGSAFESHLMVSRDDAASFAEEGAPFDPTLLLESVEVAESDPARLYISAVRGEGKERTGAFLVSSDGGATWREKKLELASGETAAFIANVDPSRADCVYVRTHGPVDTPTRLLVTDDGGTSWRNVFDAATPLLGFALSEGGGGVFIGNREGVFASTTADLTFTKVAAVETQCLGVHGARLWACSAERSGFFVGASNEVGTSNVAASKEGGVPFETRVHLADIRGVLPCPTESTVGEECSADEWARQRRALGLPDPRTNDRDAGVARPPVVASGSIGLRGRVIAIAVVVMIGLWVFVVRRRRG